MSEQFRTNCEDGEPHVPQDRQNDTVCQKCGQKISQTSEGSGYWFTKEDGLKWDSLYNEGL